MGAGAWAPPSWNTVTENAAAIYSALAELVASCWAIMATREQMQGPGSRLPLGGSALTLDALALHT
jgi:hypothetical protein